MIHAAYSICPDCGFEFPKPDRSKHDARASSAGILSGQVTTERYEVQDVSYWVHEKRGAEPDRVCSKLISPVGTARKPWPETSGALLA